MALATMPGGASLTEKRWAELSQYAPWKKIIHSSAQQLTQEKEHERETPRLAHIGARHVERSEAGHSDVQRKSREFQDKQKEKEFVEPIHV